MISLDKDKDDPQLVFERINSTGEDLTLSDLIRNYILMTDHNMEELYEDYWLPIEKNVGKDKLVSFFQTYLIYRLPDNNKDQYQSFKNYVNKNHISHEDLLIEMKRLSRCYSAFVAYSPDYSEKINNVLDGFRSLKQATIYPFLFSVFDDLENGVISEDTLYSVLVFFLNYNIRRSITGAPDQYLERTVQRTLQKDFPQRRLEKDISSLHILVYGSAHIQRGNAERHDLQRQVDDRGSL